MSATRLERPQRKRRLAPRTAAPVARLVDHDRQEPWPKWRAAAEAAERLPGLHEPVLGCVLGVRGRPCDEVGGTERDVLVFAHELGVRAGIAGERSVQRRPASRQ
jgi:hypothetical protein